MAVSRQNDFDLDHALTVKGCSNLAGSVSQGHLDLATEADVWARTQPLIRREEVTACGALPDGRKRHPTPLGAGDDHRVFDSVDERLLELVFAEFRGNGRRKHDVAGLRAGTTLADHPTPSLMGESCPRGRGATPIHPRASSKPVSVEELLHPNLVESAVATPE